MLKSALQFEPARPDDVPEIRRIFRDNAMGRAIRLATDWRGPNAGVTRHNIVVGRRANGALFGVGMRDTRSLHVNGEPRDVAYLHGLRLDQDHRNNPRVLLRGYDALRQLCRDDAITFTTVMADNLIARRFFEANVRGMPRYVLAGELHTLVMRVRNERAAATDESTSISVDQLNAGARRFQLSAVYDSVPESMIECDGMWASVRRRESAPTVVAGYSRGMRVAKPFVNAASIFGGTSRLPAVGMPLNIGYVSHFGYLNVTRPEAVFELFRRLHAGAHTMKWSYLALLFPPGDAVGALVMARFGGRLLRSILYRVHWFDRSAESFDARPFWPEVAWL